MKQETKYIIFHLPLKINTQRPSASQLRPIKMIHAFEELGYSVDLVIGTGKERKKAIREIKKRIREGRCYDFLYSESSTMPTLLTEKHHYPLFPFLDFSFFSYCKKHKIPIGLFYRDIYWVFNKPKLFINPKDYIATFFYRYDLIKYNKLVDVLYLPSFEMAKYIPRVLTMKLSELPPGVDNIISLENKPGHVENKNKPVSMFYVGGMGKHYDLKLLFRVLNRLPNLSLVVCCRKDDWIKVENEYAELISNNIHIIHKSGDELIKYYKNADLFSIFASQSVYRTFAVPYKLFESIGYGLPILATKGTWVGDFVKKNNIGAVCEYSEDELFQVLSNLTTILPEKNKVLDVAKKHRWLDRAKYVQRTLNNIIK